jgi:hypothetical protein
MDGLDEVIPVTSIVSKSTTLSEGPKSSAHLDNSTLGTTDMWCYLFCYLGQTRVFTITRPGTTNIELTMRKILQSPTRQNPERIQLEIILFTIPVAYRRNIY